MNFTISFVYQGRTIQGDVVSHQTPHDRFVVTIPDQQLPESLSGPFKYYLNPPNLLTTDNFDDPRHEELAAIIKDALTNELLRKKIMTSDPA